MKKNVKTAVFKGNRYKIAWQTPVEEGWVGSCEEPSAKGKKIEISPDLEGKDLMRVAIDEALHACFWDLDHEMVAEASESISTFLDRIGYKQTDK